LNGNGKAKQRLEIKEDGMNKGKEEKDAKKETGN
jgi:hypothetical protein